MTESSSEIKAKKYLAEGKITVVALMMTPPVHAVLHAQGSAGQPYVVTYRGDWSCNCPAYTAKCAHIEAAMLITDMPVTAPTLATGDVDDDIAALLATEPDDVTGLDPHELEH
jgi:hypothetical protein